MDGFLFQFPEHITLMHALKAETEAEFSKMF